jgi:glucose dehydrogenase
MDGNHIFQLIFAVLLVGCMVWMVWTVYIGAWESRPYIWVMIITLVIGQLCLRIEARHAQPIEQTSCPCEDR